MSVQEIADQYYAWAQQGDWTKIQDKLYHPDAWSIEAPGADSPPVHGLDSIKQKGLKWSANIKEVHSAYCKEPTVAGNHFSVAMGTTYTDVNDERQQLDEICVFEVKNEQIVKEQFFY